MWMLIVLNVQYHQNLQKGVVKIISWWLFLYDKGMNSKKTPNQSELLDTILFCDQKFSIALS